ncbi:MAG TPA: rhodanese-like domain-containing protein [Methylomirabilota bacterium]|nr:rhodanese-like domain-containing protein [Methylomirabilota bacterium]
MKNKNLLVVLVLCVLPLAASFAADQKTAVKRVDVAEFDKLRADKQNVVLDVRSAKEFKEGHIPGAINLDVRAPDFEEKVAKLDKNKTYLVHCGAGVRSANACQKMQSAGFKELYDLAPGFKGWEKAGKAVEK